MQPRDEEVWAAAGIRDAAENRIASRRGYLFTCVCSIRALSALQKMQKKTKTQVHMHTETIIYKHLLANPVVAISRFITRQYPDLL